MSIYDKIDALKQANANTLGMLSTNMKEFHDQQGPVTDPKLQVYRDRELAFIQAVNTQNTILEELKTDLKNLLSYIHEYLHDQVTDTSCGTAKCAFNDIAPGKSTVYPVSKPKPPTPGGSGGSSGEGSSSGSGGSVGN